jgi:Secretion system C-terminal sorting domain
MKKPNCLILLLIALTIAPTSECHAQWEQTNGPLGGETSALVVSGNNVFVCVDGNIYLSTNNGTRWNSTNMWANLIVASGENLFASQGGEGVFLSTNGGVDWTAVNNGLPSGNTVISSLMVNGTNLFVCIEIIVLGVVGQQPPFEVYRSTDNGSNWTSSSNGLTTTHVNVFATGQNKTGDTNVFAGTSSGVFLSTNNGGLWSSIGLDNISISALAVISNGMAGTSIFAGTSSGLFLSTDTGSHWNVANSGLSDTLVKALAVSPSGSGIPNIFAGTQGGNVYISSNDGASWTAVSSGLLTGAWEGGISIHSLTVTGTDIFACTNAGVFLSTNYGTIWKPVNNGISVVAVNAIAVDSNITGNANIFAGTFPSGVFLSTDNGSNWTPVNYGINNGDINALAISGKNIFAGGAGGAYRSTNNGASWNNIGLMNSGEVVALLGASNGAGDRVILAGTWNGAYLSTDNGGSWDSTGLAGDVQALAVSPRDSGGMNIFEGTRGSGIFLSTDKGATWNSLHNGIPKVEDINALSFNGATLFAATDYVLYFSSDNGTSWNSTTLPTTSNTWICSLAISPSGGGNADIFVGTNDEGVLVSTNNGATWRSANTGLTDTCVYSLAISGSYLFAGTNMRGVWKRQLSELTSVQETTPTQVPHQYSLSQNFPNPFNPTTVISYQLAANTVVTLKVYDILGREIKTLINEGQTAGSHSVLFDGSNLASGVYFYRLQAGSFIQTKRLILLK